MAVLLSVELNEAARAFREARIKLDCAVSYREASEESVARADKELVMACEKAQDALAVYLEAEKALREAALNVVAK